MVKTHRLLIPAALVAVSLFAASTAALSDEGERCHQGHHAGKTDGRHGDYHGFHDKLDKLNLTSAQQAQVKDILDKQKPQREARMKELQESRKALHEATRSASFDSAKVREIANRQAAAHAELTVLRAETRHQIYSLLTPEQKQKWDAQRPRRGDVEKS